MLKIAEKLKFTKVKAVKVCAQAGIGRKPGHNNLCFCGIFQKNGQKIKGLCYVLDFTTSYCTLRCENRVF